MPPAHSSQTAVVPAPARTRERGGYGRLALRVAVLLGLATLAAFRLAHSDALEEARSAYAQNDDPTATRRALDHLARWPRSQAAARIAALALSRQNYAALAEPYYARAGELSLEDMHVRAESLMRCNERLKALEAFEAILAIKPDDVQALRFEAGVLLTMMRRSQALNLATRLTQTKGGELIGYTMTGFIQHMLEDPESAVAAYERVLELDPELKQVVIPHRQFWLEFTRDLLRQGRTAEAKRYTERALAEGEDAELLDMLGSAYEQEGANEDAERTWRRAVRVDPSHSPSWLKLGLLAMHADRLDEACSSLERAVALSPNYYSAVYNLGLTYRRLGRLEDAKRVLDDAARIRRTMPVPAGGMGAMPGGGSPQ